MKTTFYTLLYIALTALPLLTSCDDNFEEPVVAKDLTTLPHGTFTDSRDGNVYHFVTIGNLDWTLENAQYDTGSEATCINYAIDQVPKKNGLTTEQQSVSVFGYLYTLKGASIAAPEGWRVPTDEDWKKLEEYLGMNEKEADGEEWRGNIASSLLSNNGLALKLAGWKDNNAEMCTEDCNFIQAFGFYWTSTTTENDMAYFRKIESKRNEVYRNLTKTDNMLSVRYVRDTK